MPKQLYSSVRLSILVAISTLAWGQTSNDLSQWPQPLELKTFHPEQKLENIAIPARKYQGMADDEEEALGQVWRRELEGEDLYPETATSCPAIGDIAIPDSGGAVLSLGELALGSNTTLPCPVVNGTTMSGQVIHSCSASGETSWTMDHCQFPQPTSCPAIGDIAIPGSGGAVLSLGELALGSNTTLPCPVVNGTTMSGQVIHSCSASGETSYTMDHCQPTSCPAIGDFVIGPGMVLSLGDTGLARGSNTTVPCPVVNGTAMSGQVIYSCSASGDINLNIHCQPPPPPEEDDDDDSLYPEAPPAAPPGQVVVTDPSQATAAVVPITIQISPTIANAIVNDPAVQDAFKSSYVADMAASLALEANLIEVTGVSIDGSGRRLLHSSRRLQSVGLVVDTKISAPAGQAMDGVLTTLNSQVSTGLTLDSVTTAIATDAAFATAKQAAVDAGESLAITVPEQNLTPVLLADAPTTSTDAVSTSTASTAAVSASAASTAAVSTSTPGAAAADDDDVVEASPAACMASNIMSLVVSLTMCVWLQRR